MTVDESALREVEQRVLWLATSIVHGANAGRPNDSGVKVGGHQTSSASMVSVMTALWFDALTAADRVSVKPHASVHAMPVSCLGVSTFGQGGGLPDVYRVHGLDAASIVGGALDLVDECLPQ